MSELSLALVTPDFRASSGGGAEDVERRLVGEGEREGGAEDWICWSLWDELRSERRRAKFWRRERVGEEGEGDGFVGEGAVVKVRGS